jgi:hypothetical protein
LNEHVLKFYQRLCPTRRPQLSLDGRDTRNYRANSVMEGRLGIPDLDLTSSKSAMLRTHLMLRLTRQIVYIDPGVFGLKDCSSSVRYTAVGQNRILFVPPPQPNRLWSPCGRVLLRSGQGRARPMLFHPSYRVPAVTYFITAIRSVRVLVLRVQAAKFTATPWQDG